jgi:integration host factor subunit alpha
MSAVTKADLVEHLFSVLGINKREAKEVIDLFFAEIAEALVRGETVKLPGFGTFTTKHKTPREGRNPKTGKVYPIEERRVATFKPAEPLKIKIQAYGDSVK